MNDLEQLALRHIIQLSDKCDQLVTQAALKTHSEKKEISAEKDIYPIGSVARSMGQWADAILKNKK